jgi:hypothetical protein
MKERYNELHYKLHIKNTSPYHPPAHTSKRLVQEEASSSNVTLNKYITSLAAVTFHSYLQPSPDLIIRCSPAPLLHPTSNFKTHIMSLLVSFFPSKQPSQTPQNFFPVITTSESPLRFDNAMCKSCSKIRPACSVTVRTAALAQTPTGSRSSPPRGTETGSCILPRPLEKLSTIATCITYLHGAAQRAAA